MIPSLHQTLASAKKKVEISTPVYKKMSKKNLDRDKKFEEIKNTVAKKTKAKEAEPEEEVVREAYVDPYRQIGFTLGLDLVGLIRSKNLEGESTFKPGEPNDVMYLRQAENFLKKGNCGQALNYLIKSLTMNPESKLAMATLARCHLVMGNWEYAQMAAEIVLGDDKKFVQAIYAKAEALYNTCQFEHALVYFVRGQRLDPGDPRFRLGAQKCKKTIQVLVSSHSIYKVRGARIIFVLLRRASDFRTARSHILSKAIQSGTMKMVNKENAFEDAKGKGTKKNMAGLAGIMSKKKADEANKGALIKAKWGAVAPQQKKSEQKTEDEEEQTEDDVSREQRRQRRIERVEKRCQEKAKKFLTSDRLLEDKTYLTNLSRGIGPKPGVDFDDVELGIAESAYEALFFLQGREEFWKQVNMGQARKSSSKDLVKNNKKSSTIR